LAGAAVERTGAYPGYLHSCVAWVAGDSGYMSASTLADGAGGKCSIDISAIPASGFVGDTEYSVVVTSDRATLNKLYSSDGQCLGNDFGDATLAKSKTFTWVAPGSDVTFHAMCSTGFTQIFAAPAAAVSYSGTSRALTPAPAPISPSPAVATAKVGTGMDIALGADGLKLSFEPLGVDSVQFEVSIDRDAWIGFGLSSGSAVSMTAGGAGSDVVTCSNGQVKQYKIVSYAIPTTAVDVPGSSCKQENGKTTLRFARTIAAQDSQQRDLTPGSSQQIIWAYGDDGVQLQQFHGSNKGGKNIDFASGNTVAAAKRSGEAVLFLHLALMAIAWGGFIPLGAIIANRFHIGSWFVWHRGLQSIGWLLQLVGFVMAVVYAQEHSSHFSVPHAVIGLVVVVIGTAQPLNALVRPHVPAEGERKSMKRKVWEVVHKGSGWIAVALGAANVFIGAAAARAKDYEGAVVGTAVGLGIFCMLIPLCVLVLSFVAKNRMVDLLRLLPKDTNTGTDSRVTMFGRSSLEPGEPVNGQKQSPEHPATGIV